MWHSLTKVEGVGVTRPSIPKGAEAMADQGRGTDRRQREGPVSSVGGVCCMYRVCYSKYYTRMSIINIVRPFVFIILWCPRLMDRFELCTMDYTQECLCRVKKEILYIKKW